MPRKVNIPQRVLRHKKVRWRDLDFIQSDEFKELSNDKKERLKQSYREHGYIDEIKVWHDEKADKIYCLDGKHRTLILDELSNEGENIPDELVATWIDCKDIDEAAQLVLVYSSHYAKITAAGLTEFLDHYDIKAKKLQEVVDVPFLDEIVHVQTEAMKSSSSDEDDERSSFSLNVQCDDENHCQELFNELKERGHKVKIVT